MSRHAYRMEFQRAHPPLLLSLRRNLCLPVVPIPMISSYQVGGKFGLLELIRADLVYGPTFSGGWWIARCTGPGGGVDLPCLKLVRVHKRDLERAARKGYSCANCPPPPPDYRPSIKRDQPHLCIAGNRFGRLTPISWHRGYGWLCVCATCGGRILAGQSAVMMELSRTDCTGKCVGPFDVV
jgi:hypothetical protein